MAGGLRFRPRAVTSGVLAPDESSHCQKRCSKPCVRCPGSSPDGGFSGKPRIDAEHLQPAASCSWSTRLPVSDHKLDLRLANVLLSSAQSREKCLKVFQYILKFLAYVFMHAASFLGLANALAKDWADRAARAAKLTSQARRFFKFFRWLKHFEDVSAVRKEGTFGMRILLMFSIGSNLVADILEDICSLQRLGFIAAGSLPTWFELDANRCQLVLAIIEIALSAVRFRRRQAEIAKENGEGGGSSLASRRMLAMARLELSKFVADLGKAFWDCECSFAPELLFIVCGLWAGIVSTHKYALKALK